MKPLALLAAVVGSFLFVPASRADQACRYMQSRSGLAGYENGGLYILDHFHLTKGRTNLREFLWQHWHGHKKGVAEARVRSVDRGTVRVLYLIQPDAQGRWGVDVEISRPADPPCLSFYADSLVRVPIAKPDEEYPSQTSGLWPVNKLPANIVADSAVVDSKFYRLMLVRNNKPLFSDLI
jgi:hypothetical protein